MNEKNKIELVIVETKEDSNVKPIPIKKQIEALSSNPEFNIFQEMLQEIQATDITESLDYETNVPLTKQLEKLKELINSEYAEQENIKTLLLDYFPSYKTIYSWIKKEEWKEAVVAKIKTSYSFSEKRRAKVLDSIYKKAVQKDDMKAAELYCKLAGEFKTEKESKDSKEIDSLKTFNNILHRKK